MAIPRKPKDMGIPKSEEREGETKREATKSRANSISDVSPPHSKADPRLDLAAINPPTWWHCLMSEQLASCITSHLFEREPLLFKEVPGYPDKEAVCAFVGKAGRLHDAGKIFIAEAVTNYAREYCPDEEDWLMIW